MSTILFGALVADARGKLGGMVLSKSAGGNTARNKTKPVNPHASGQESARARLTSVAWHWNHVCTAQNRTDWNAYAAATSWTNKLGQSIAMSGMSAFARLNALLQLIGHGFWTPPPTQNGHAGNPLCVMTANVTAQTLVFAEPPLPFDKTVLGSNIVVYQGSPCQPGQLSAPKGKIYAGTIAGAVAPPAFPLSIASKFTFTAGQRVFVWTRYTDQYHRVGEPVLISAIAAVP